MSDFAAIFVKPGYETLTAELQKALHHANACQFTQQPIMEISRMVGPGGTAYQVMKKTQEAMHMVDRGQNDRAIAELHEAIVYAAACALLIREQLPDEQ